MPMLDIIVTHYDEDWQVGEKFFTMLDLQRGIDFSQIHVILVNDGKQYELPQDHFIGRPYSVEQISIEHGGISAARNAGLKQSTSKWVCFCDFDDMYAGVYSLRNVLHVLPTDDYDMQWADFYSEDQLKNGETRLNLRGENLVFVHSKFYRRQFLIDNQLEFDTDLIFNEDSLFNTVLNTMTDYKRIGKIETEAPLYVWCFREGSATATPENHFKTLYGLYDRNKKVCEAYKKRLPYDRYCAMVARMVMDSYYALNVETLPDELKPMLEDFRQFYHDHKADYAQVDRKTLREIKNVSKQEYEIGNREEKERWNICQINQVREDISVTKWLEMLEINEAKE